MNQFHQRKSKIPIPELAISTSDNEEVCVQFDSLTETITKPCIMNTKD